MSRCRNITCRGPIPRVKRADSEFCSDKCRVSAYRSRNKNVTLPREKTILSLCDYSGNWSKPYSQAGYNVIRIDLRHGQDVRLLKFPGETYGVLAAPPCERLARSGARFWQTKGEVKLLESLALVDACARLILSTRPRFWALENPVGRLTSYLGEPTWIFNPCDFGDPYTKKTCLWGNFNIPKPERVSPIQAPPGSHSIDMYLKSRGHTLGKYRPELRGFTPEGFAKAFFAANP